MKWPEQLLNNLVNPKQIEEDSEQNCSFDGLEISDATEQIAYLCGYDLPEPITSLSNSLVIRLTTDDSVTEKGFLIEYYSGQWDGGLYKSFPQQHVFVTLTPHIFILETYAQPAEGMYVLKLMNCMLWVFSAILRVWGKYQC